MPWPTFTDFTGIAGVALALSATPLVIPGVRRLVRARLAVLLAGVTLLVLIRFGTLSVAEGVRGVFGDLSMTTLVLLGSAILRRLTSWPPENERARFALVVLIAATAVVFYPLALGVGRFDPYRLGYGSPWLVGGLLAVALAAWFSRCDVIAICLALATLAWTLHWQESTNLWDYLLDPLVSGYALGRVAVYFSAAGFGLFKSKYRDVS